MSTGRVVAVMDVGSNAVKLTVARVAEGRIQETLAERRVQTRLGEGVAAHGAYSDASVAQTCGIIREMVEEARRHGAGTIRIAGTSAVREATNAGALSTCIEAAAGLRLEVLSGEEEARLSFEAVYSEGEGPEVAVFDLGGGSVQWILGSSGRVTWRRSFPIGAVRLAASLKPDPPSDEAIAAARKSIRDAFAEVPDLRGRSLVGAGGTVRVMLGIAEAAGLAPRERHLTLAEASRQVRLFASQTQAERKSIAGMDPDRADIILPGALVVEECLERAGADHLVVSYLGWRHGLAVETA